MGDGLEGPTEQGPLIDARALHELLAGPHPAIDSEDPGPAGFTGSLVVAGGWWLGQRAGSDSTPATGNEA